MVISLFSRSACPLVGQPNPTPALPLAAMRLLVWEYITHGPESLLGRPLAKNEFRYMRGVIEYRPVYVWVDVLFGDGAVSFVKTRTLHRPNWGWGTTDVEPFWVLSDTWQSTQPHGFKEADHTRCPRRCMLPFDLETAKEWGLLPIQLAKPLDQVLDLGTLVRSKLDDFQHCAGWLYLWNPRWHKHAPADVKQVVWMAMQIHTLERGSLLAALPIEMLFEVFHWL